MCAKAKPVLILRAGSLGDQIVIQRRGQREYLFRAEGKSLRLGRPRAKGQEAGNC